MSHTPRNRTAVSTALIVALGAGVTACGSDSHPLSAKPYDAAEDISFNTPVDDGKKADPDKPLEITAEDSDGRITDVTATDAAGRYLAGELSADGTRWHSTSPLAAGAHYRVRVSTEDEDGAPGRKVVDFDTGIPTTKKRLDVKFGPDKGTYGVGQPVTAELSLPVKDKAARAVVERSLKVDSRPAVDGAWHWVDDKKLHYRPKEYWPAQATISARSNLSGIKVAERLWGGKAKPLTLTTGDRVEAVTDASAHSMTVYRNGEAIKTIPVTTGKPGYDTRNGVKVVLGKEGTRSHDAAPASVTPRLLRPDRPQLDQAHQQRRVRSRRPLVHRLPGLRQRQPRLHRHEYRQRPVVLREHPRRRHRPGRQLVRRHDGPVRQRLRRLEPRPGRNGARAAPSWPTPRRAPAQKPA